MKRDLNYMYYLFNINDMTVPRQSSLNSNNEALNKLFRPFLINIPSHSAQLMTNCIAFEPRLVDPSIYSRILVHFIFFIEKNYVNN